MHCERALHLAGIDGIAEQAVIVEALVGKDVADHIAAGHELAELVPIEAASTLAVLHIVRSVTVVDSKLVEGPPKKMSTRHRESCQALRNRVVC